VTPLPSALGATPNDVQPLVAWTLCATPFAATWDSGEGAYLFGGRWNSKGQRVVYAAVDPSTAILEVAVHKGFRVLDTVPHTLVRFTVSDPAQVHVVQRADVPNPHWLVPGTPSAGQQQFGDALLVQHPFVLIPSTVSPHSWNLLVNASTAKALVTEITKEAFALDTRLHPPV
jgi:RES domain-containing protein